MLSMASPFHAFSVLSIFHLLHVSASSKYDIWLHLILCIPRRLHLAVVIRGAPLPLGVLGRGVRIQDAVRALGTRHREHSLYISCQQYFKQLLFRLELKLKLGVIDARCLLGVRTQASSKLSEHENIIVNTSCFL